MPCWCWISAIPTDLTTASVANTFIGGISIEGGVLSAVGIGALGDPANAIYLGTAAGVVPAKVGTLQVQNPYVLQAGLPPAIQTPTALDMGNHTIEVRDGGGAIDVQLYSLRLGAAGGLINTAGSLAPGALTKIGAGELILANNFTNFLGGLNVNVGAARLDDAGGAGTGTITIGGGTLLSNVAAPVLNNIVINSGNIGSVGTDRVFGNATSTLRINAAAWAFSSGDYDQMHPISGVTPPPGTVTDRITTLAGIVTIPAAGQTVSVFADGTDNTTGGLFLSSLGNSLNNSQWTVYRGGALHVTTDGAGNFSIPARKSRWTRQRIPQRWDTPTASMARSSAYVRMQAPTSRIS